MLEQLVRKKRREARIEKTWKGRGDGLVSLESDAQSHFHSPCGVYICSSRENRTLSPHSGYRLFPLAPYSGCVSDSVSYRSRPPAGLFGLLGSLPTGPPQRPAS